MTRPWSERSAWSAALTIALWVFTLSVIAAMATSGTLRTVLLIASFLGLLVAGGSGMAIWLRFGFRPDDAQWPLWHDRAGPRRRSRWLLALSVIALVAAMALWFAVLVLGVDVL